MFLSSSWTVLCHVLRSCNVVFVTRFSARFVLVGFFVAKSTGQRNSQRFSIRRRTAPLDILPQYYHNVYVFVYASNPVRTCVNNLAALRLEQASHSEEQRAALILWLVCWSLAFIGLVYFRRIERGPHGRHEHIIITQLRCWINKLGRTETTAAECNRLDMWMNHYLLVKMAIWMCGDFVSCASIFIMTYRKLELCWLWAVSRTRRKTKTARGRGDIIIL